MPGLFQIAIIGGGPGGVSVCLQLAQHLEKLDADHHRNLEISIFEKNSFLGYGMPYACPEPSFCINLPKEFMKLTPEGEDDFPTWILKNHPDKDITPYPSRFYFGKYTEHRLYHEQKKTS